MTQQSLFPNKPVCPSGCTVCLALIPYLCYILVFPMQSSCMLYFCTLYLCVHVNAFASAFALIVVVHLDFRLVQVCVYIFPAALPPGMQHGSSKGDISADRRASFPSPLPSGVALNIKLFNLIQFPTTNTLDWIQMPATSGPTPGQLSAWALDNANLGKGAGIQTQIKFGTGSGDANAAPAWS